MNQAVDSLLAKCEEVSGCWLYRGRVDSEGYARKQVGGKQHYAHRLVYEYMVADIPDGLVIDHLCRNRNCLNPWHMEPVPNGVNVSRGIKANATKTYCMRGHEFDRDNTRVEPDGARKCRKCAAGRAAERRRLRSLRGTDPLRVGHSVPPFGLDNDQVPVS